MRTRCIIHCSFCSWPPTLMSERRGKMRGNAAETGGVCVALRTLRGLLRASARRLVVVDREPKTPKIPYQCANVIYKCGNAACRNVRVCSLVRPGIPHVTVRREVQFAILPCGDTPRRPSLVYICYMDYARSMKTTIIPPLQMQRSAEMRTERWRKAGKPSPGRRHRQRSRSRARCRCLGLARRPSASRRCLRSSGRLHPERSAKLI